MKNKKWFTLIEMLIVIVIIGILATAIIPRLNSARSRANDVARKADLNQVANALITYQLDVWSFPVSAGTTIDTISEELTKWWLTAIPKDPNNNGRFSWSNALTNPSQPFNWYYVYQTVEKNWIPNGWFILMTQMESAGQANYLICWAEDIIWNPNSNSYSNIELCSKITYSKNATSCDKSNLNNCISNNLLQLRYIYKH